MNHPSPSKSKYSIKDFLPLILLFLIITGLTIARYYYAGDGNLNSAMADFMGFFFLIFGGFKILNLKGFAKAYQEYDIIAKRSLAYAYLYPFLEIGLGIAYLMRWNPYITNLATFILMSVSAIGVGIELSKGKTIVCACLGTVFKVPMTYVTLLEDLLMAGMALFMLIK